MTTQSHPMNPMHGHAMMSHSQHWRTWPDWVNVVVGAYVALAPLWTTGASAVWFIVLGILAIAAAVWALDTGSSSVSEWVQMVIGVVLFVSPWFASFSGRAGATWTAWIAGVALVVFAIIGMMMARRRA